MAQPNGFAVGIYGFPNTRIGFFVDAAGNLYQVTQNSSGQQVVINLSAGGGGGGGTWGSIVGTLSNQTDLQAALDTLTNAANAAQTTANTGVTNAAAAQTTANSKISTLAAASDFITASLATSNTSIVNGLAAAAAGGAPVAWQTVTPNVSNAVPIAINRNNGINVKLLSPVDNTQVVQLPTNMADGQEMEIDLYGGGASGSWVTWSAGSPATPGYYFASGAAPIAPGAGLIQQVFVKRDGALYRAVFGGIQVAN